MHEDASSDYLSSDVIAREVHHLTGSGDEVGTVGNVVNGGGGDTIKGEDGVEFSQPEVQV